MSTLDEIAKRVVLKLGDTTVGQFYSSLMVYDAIGEAYRYYSMILIKEGEGYFETTTDLSITANVETIDLSGLSPVFMKASQVWKNTVYGEIPLHKRENRYVVNSTYGTGTGDLYLPNYRFRGNNLVLMPTPQASETDAIKLDYVYLPTFPNSTSASTFSFDSGFPTIYEHNVVLRACITLLSGKQTIGGAVNYSTYKTDLQEADLAMLDSMSKSEEPDEVQYVGEYYDL